MQGSLGMYEIIIISGLISRSLLIILVAESKMDAEGFGMDAFNATKTGTEVLHNVSNFWTHK
jgi:hypothetical protein